MLQVQFSSSQAEPAVDWLLDSDGFLLDPNDWMPEFTEQHAAREGIELTQNHWQLIEIIRDKYLRLGALPPIRSVCKSSGLDRYQLKSQFGSCLNLWKMAGLPYPGDEAIAYMQ